MNPRLPVHGAPGDQRDPWLALTRNAKASMSDTVGDFILQRLSAWGVRRVFGYPGDGINGLMGALDRAADQIEFVQARHEEMAAFMACGHAKFTGEVGVCMATSGPGAIHLLNGLYDAKMDHQPVVAIVGQQARTALGGDYQQEVDLHSLFKDVARSTCRRSRCRHRCATWWIARCASPSDQRTRDLHHRAQRPAGCSSHEEPPREHGTVHTGIGYYRALHVPRRSRHCRRRRHPQRRQARSRSWSAPARCTQPTRWSQVADRLGAGVAKALLGKAVLPDDLPFVTGAIGLLGTKPSWEMMSRCDTLLMVGSGFPYSEYLPEGRPGARRADRHRRAQREHALSDGGEPGRRQRGGIAAIGGQGARKVRAGLARAHRAGCAQVVARAGCQSHGAAEPINPQRIFRELSPACRMPASFVAIAVRAGWYARDVKLREGMLSSMSGKLATMGSGMPYALAAKLAWPDRPVLGHRWRRCHADEQQRRAHHSQAVLAALEKSLLRGHGTGQSPTSIR